MQEKSTALPRTFDEYNEARKQSFLKVKEYKEQGGKLVGFLCSYAPLEIVDAAGAAAVGLCGTSNETVPTAEEVLPSNLCPLVKSTYGFARSQKCPFTHFSDLIVGETTCDGKKKMYELLGEMKPVYVLSLPHTRDRAWAADAWYQEVKRFKEELERRFGTTVTDEDLRAAVRRRNRLRRALTRLFELQKSVPPAMSGVELMSVLQAANFSFDIEEYAANLERLADEREGQLRVDEGSISPDAKRILVTGCPTGGVINKIGKTIKEHGGVVVCTDDCSGERTQRMEVDPAAPDILRAIADRYLQINCSVMTPNDGRMENTLSQVRAYRADGVVESILTACHTFNVEGVLMQRAVEGAGIPYLKIETDYAQADMGQVQTRLEAFLEML